METKILQESFADLVTKLGFLQKIHELSRERLRVRVRRSREIHRPHFWKLHFCFWKEILLSHTCQSRSDSIRLFAKDEKSVPNRNADGER